MRKRLAMALIAALAAAGCARGVPIDPATGDPPQIVHDAATNSDRIVLSEQAAGRLGITTAPVRQLPGTGLAEVPVAAVLYDQDGTTWVYTSPSPLNYVRQAVTLGPVDADQWELTSGPAPGTLVVTVGGAELLGAELGVEGE